MNPKKRMLRRIASNKIQLEDGSILSQSVVEIQHESVLSSYPLTQELPHTEWLPGCVQLSRTAEGYLLIKHNGTIIN